MPILGVIKLTLDEDDESMRGDDDFFSVARTIPFVAEEKQSEHELETRYDGHTLDSQ